MMLAADVNSSASVWDALMSRVPPTSHQSSRRTLHPRIMRSWSVTLGNLMSLEPGGPQVYFVIRSSFSKVCRTYHVMMKILLCLWVRDIGSDGGSQKTNQRITTGYTSVYIHKSNRKRARFSCFAHVCPMFFYFKKRQTRERQWVIFLLFVFLFHTYNAHYQNAFFLRVSKTRLRILPSYLIHSFDPYTGDGHWEQFLPVPETCHR